MDKQNEQSLKNKKHMKEYFNQQKYWLESGSIYDISVSSISYIKNMI